MFLAARKVASIARQSLYRRRSFTVLALESSADDTCAAIVSSSGQILSNVVVKQHAFHERFGGIHPFHAIHAHQQHMPGAIQKALQDSNLSLNEVDGIAFTRGPAKALAAATNKPLVGVHHMQAHALTPLLTTPDIQFPFLALLISGGHTLLLLARSKRSFHTLATTVDESVGNVFDKVANILSIPWDGLGPGAALERFCSTHTDEPLPEIHPPLPQASRSKLSFSFTGLHSSVERFVTARDGTLDHPTKLALARAFQTAAIGHLEEKVLLGLIRCRQKGVDVRHVVVSGGVASNQFLRHRLDECIRGFECDYPIQLVFPPPSLCTDNAVMIAWAAMHRFLAFDHDVYEIETRPKWDIQDKI